MHGYYCKARHDRKHLSIMCCVWWYLLITALHDIVYVCVRKVYRSLVKGRGIGSGAHTHTHMAMFEAVR